MKRINYLPCHDVQLVAVHLTVLYTFFMSHCAFLNLSDDDDDDDDNKDDDDNDDDHDDVRTGFF